MVKQPEKEKVIKLCCTSIETKFTAMTNINSIANYLQIFCY